jgi:hypothetical protein
MPIRLNLLAEAQAIEDLRRRDPVKRAMWAGALMSSLMLVWSSSLQLKAMMANNEVGRVEGQMTSRNKEFQDVLGNQKKTEEIRQKLAALQQLTTNRFLQATLLNALQQATAEDVQLIRVKTDQSYTYREETKARTNANGVLPYKPASVIEKIVLSLDGTDSSSNPGDQVNTFKQILGTNAYFREALGRTNVANLKSMSQPQLLPTAGSTAGKASVQFTLECRYPEKTR